MVVLPGKQAMQSTGRSETSMAALQTNEILTAKHIGTVRLNQDRENVSFKLV